MPPQIRQLVSEWRAAGSPAQDGIPWPRQRWVARFPSHASVFAMLPDRLSRLVIRGACLGAAANPVAAERAFLAVMAWGYGWVGTALYVPSGCSALPGMAVQVDVGSRTRRQAAPVGVGELVPPGRVGEHDLDHDGVYG
jgi:hypothetical protein